LELPFAQLADHGAVALALGHAVGRIGCLLGGCCYGLPWRGLDGHGLLAVTYADPLAPAAHPSLPRFPMPLCEAVLVLLLIGVLWRVHARSASRHHGRLALHYALGYAMLRFVLETVRGDAVRGVMLDGMLSTSQLLSMLVLVIALAATLRMRPRLFLVLSVWLLSVAALAVGDARAQLRMQAPAVVQIAAGWFTLGSDEADVDVAVELCRLDADRPEICRSEIFDDERPARRVYLSAYRIDRTEVSNGSYRRCVAANICAPQRLSDADQRVAAPEHPVTGITFGEASRFCAWLGGKLPTEAQWEKGARGTNARRFPWGNLWNSRLANHGRGMGLEDPIDGYNYAAPVDAFVDARSPYGLHNMAGNVAEMTLDYYDERGYAEADRIDPRGPREGGERVVRGGSWRSPAFTLRTTHRTHIAENDTQPDVGFRCSYSP
jgi:formylglycine-generating enzyme required for sulfatase activity